MKTALPTTKRQPRTRLHAALRILPRRFRRSEDGNATIELALWFPFVIAAFALAADVALVFVSYSAANRIVQEAGRLYSTGRYKTKAEVENHILVKLQPMAPSVQAFCEGDRGAVITRAAFPVDEVDGAGIFPALKEATIVVESQIYVEYYPDPSEVLADQSLGPDC